jgi:hypothetical protein
MESLLVTKKRTVGAQVRSGLRIAGCILLVFAVFVLLELSLALAVGLANPHTSVQRLFGAVSALGLMLFMFRTAKYWARWLFAALAYALVRLTGVLLLTPYVSKPVTGSTVAVWILYACASVALTLRYVRRHPRRFESIGLVSFVVGIAVGLVYGAQEPLLAGLAMLGLAEALQWLHHKKTHRQSEALGSQPPA